jgi:phenylpropionate dioxygenase-like ring-hydroxylating dioxygenase large terminal subunit
MRLAASWYPVLQSSELGRKPVALKRFGERLLAWRDSNRTPTVVGDSSRHASDSLTEAEVHEQAPLRRHFLGRWFEGVGRGVDDSEERRIATKTDGLGLITVERYGYIWAWWGTEQPLFSLPRLAEGGGCRCPEKDPSSAVWPMQFQWQVRASPRIIVANNFDATHLKYVHSVPFESVRRWATEDAGEFIGPQGVASDTWPTMSSH